MPSGATWLCDPDFLRARVLKIKRVGTPKGGTLARTILSNLSIKVTCKTDTILRQIENQIFLKNARRPGVATRMADRVIKITRVG